MKRNHEIRIKLSKEELKKIELKAEELGLKPAAFLRLLGLKSLIKVSEVE